MKVEKFKVLLYLKKSELNKSGKAPIMGRITVNRTMAQFGCKLSCTPGLWNPRESRLNGKGKEAVETNAKIEKLLLAVNTAFDNLVSRKVDFDATDVKDLFQGSMETQMTLMKMTDAVCDDLKARIGIDRAKGTYPGYHYMRLTLGEFIEHQYKVKDLAFGQLTEQFIHDYQDFVTGALSRESFEKIRDVEIPPYRKTHMLARDLFLFACYTGVCYADVVSITHENLYTDGDGALWLKYRRKKNELRASVKLLPEAIALIEKYHSEERDTLFPLLHWSNLRRHMKALAALAGIKDDLCYHQARHSFASLITLEAGVPIETISRMLGHSDISTTQVYARVSPKKLFEDMDKFIEATQDFKLTL
ncbi:site-specific integrase [Alistipes finegoldii]|uniref:site-specific integrase n=1 Tax=Alistipes finegoldii TaxID=214856 RepID=UPI00272E4730|nr:site-specific integrase [Alistipes finegoldii]